MPVILRGLSFDEDEPDPNTATTLCLILSIEPDHSTPAVPPVSSAASSGQDSAHDDSPILPKGQSTAVWTSAFDRARQWWFAKRQLPAPENDPVGECLTQKSSRPRRGSSTCRPGGRPNLVDRDPERIHPTTPALQAPIAPESKGVKEKTKPK